MELKWTSKALSDLARLYDFLVLASKPAAARTVQSLTQAPVILLTHPRMGEQLFQFEPREVRRIFAGEYEIRYELNGQTIYVLRGNDSNLLIVFYVQIMPDDFVMQLHRF
ncbi:type II toxin-antitoxin system RelE/ParE family toxin [Escherichia coli]|uniref:type II toxin-antitoxin system RelE/ParE family toxin n=8 Tax=Gammaproteobacteria TaxID=1236 RepID=UPI0010DE35F1|nr:type II toxin-antitoxin system RelE/ParE family toxin [Escherichia coli]MCW7373383.1 type II toxin-antitoxin system RelE/ParE family toxin [Escherichia coli]GDN96313.1 plasmid stabilization protein [Escherichia coli]